MANKALTDKQGKEILRDAWPRRTRVWGGVDGQPFWFRAQPKDGVMATPLLRDVGARTSKTQPDGLWLRIWAQPIKKGGPGFVDVVVVEVCKSLTNLNDKRSRYGVSHASQMVRCRRQWLLELERNTPRWVLAEAFGSAPTHDLDFPVRSLRVIYALRNDHYGKWCANHVPAGHEYFLRHSSLNSWNSRKMQQLFKNMGSHNHFYTSR